MEKEEVKTIVKKETPVIPSAPKVGGIVLPMIPQGALKTVPENIILYGLPKCGKTTELAKLPNSLLVDFERGSQFVECNRIMPDEGTTPVAMFKWAKDVAKAIRDGGRPYDFIILETLSEMDELSEWKGTFDYMQTTQGKGFNRVDGKGSTMLKPDDPNYESVNDLAEGYGYRFSRKAMMDLYDMFKGLGRISTIFVCHVKDKYVVAKNGNGEIRTMEIALTGKLKTILAKDVDAVGYVWNKGGELNISFKGNEDLIGGMRGATHLKGYSGELDWNKIFLLNDKKETVNENNN